MNNANKEISHPIPRLIFQEKEIRRWKDPKLMNDNQLEKLTVAETQKLLIEDPPSGLD